MTMWKQWVTHNDEPAENLQLPLALQRFITNVSSLFIVSLWLQNLAAYSEKKPHFTLFDRNQTADNHRWQLAGESKQLKEKWHIQDQLYPRKFLACLITHFQSLVGKVQSHVFSICSHDAVDSFDFSPCVAVRWYRGVGLSQQLKFSAN